MKPNVQVGSPMKLKRKKPSLKDQKQTIKRLLTYISKDYKIPFICVLICILISSVAGVMGSMFLQVLIDDYITPLVASEHPVFAGLLKAIMGMMLIYIVGVIAGYCSGIIDEVIMRIIDVIFAGNALATHDIECDQFGTSLGVNVKTGEVVAHGHTHHMRAINRINNSGSIREAVEDGTLKSGIMYECIKNDVPFVLAGSIRDDGPLPDVITDTVESQKLMRKYAQEVDMVIMISTMLHSIATGNLLPSRVKSICVDINPSTVTKLADRGSAQVVGIVTDVGAFLPVLYNALHE